MSWHVRFEEELHRRSPGAGVWYTRVNRQPSWVTKTALAVALLVVVVPIVLLTLAAVVVGGFCLLVLSRIASGVRSVRGLFSPDTYRRRDDGRRNVRVIDRP